MPHPFSWLNFEGCFDAGFDTRFGAQLNDHMKDGRSTTT
jgi:hypothetical protein